MSTNTMKKYWLLLSALLWTPWLSAQDITTFLKEIKFSEDTLASVFQHVANTMDYDMRMLERIPQYTSRLQILEHAMSRRKGVCEHYSELLHQSLLALGYESYIVSGYTRMDGTLNQSFGHTWNVVKVNGSWFFMDPTYASGYVENKRFYKKYDEEWYLVLPDKMIQTHYPFDPLWQLLKYPVSHHAIKQNNLEKRMNESPWDFDKIIKEEALLTEEEAAARSLLRIKSAGVTNPLLEQRISYLNQILQTQAAKGDIIQLNTAVDWVNEAAVQFNQYQNAKSNNFKNSNWTPASIKSTLTDIQTKLERATSVFESVKLSDPSAQKDFRDLKRNTASLLAAVKKEMKSL